MKKRMARLYLFTTRTIFLINPCHNHKGAVLATPTPFYFDVQTFERIAVNGELSASKVVNIIVRVDKFDFYNPDSRLNAVSPLHTVKVAEGVNTAHGDQLSH